jgi:hypothetical protein
VAANTNRLLSVALIAVVTVAAAAPVTVRLGYGESNAEVLAVAWVLTIPPLLFTVATRRQLRRGAPARVWFAPQLLAAAALQLAGAAFVLCVAGLVGVVLDFVVVPVAAAILLLAWVQPRESDVVSTVLLGFVLVPLIVWFAGRADEYLDEALLSGGCIALVVGVLVGLRRRGLPVAPRELNRRLRP